MIRLFNRSREKDELMIGKVIEETWRDIAKSDDPLSHARAFHWQMLSSPKEKLLAEGIGFLLVRLHRIGSYGSQYERTDSQFADYFRSDMVASAVATSVMPRVHVFDRSIDVDVVTRFFLAALSRENTLSLEDIEPLGDDLLAVLILALGFGILASDSVWTEVAAYMSTSEVVDAIEEGMRSAKPFAEG